MRDHDSPARVRAFDDFSELGLVRPSRFGARAISARPGNHSRFRFRVQTSCLREVIRFDFRMNHSPGTRSVPAGGAKVTRNSRCPVHERARARNDSLPRCANLVNAINHWEIPALFQVRQPHAVRTEFETERAAVRPRRRSPGMCRHPVWRAHCCRTDASLQTPM